MNPTEWLRQVIESDDITSKTTLSLAAAYATMSDADGRVLATLKDLQESARFGSKHTVIKHRDALENAGFLEVEPGSSVRITQNMRGAASAPQSAASAPQSAASAPQSAASAPQSAASAPQSAASAPQSAASAPQSAASAPQSAASAPQSAASAPSPAKEKIPHTPLKENTSLAVAREVEEDAPATSPSDSEPQKILQEIIEDEPAETFVDTIAEFFGLDVHFGQAANIWMNAETTQDSEEKARRYIAQKFGELAGGDYASRTIERILRRDADQYDGATEINAGPDNGTAPDRQADSSMTEHLEKKRSQSDGTINF